MSRTTKKSLATLAAELSEEDISSMDAATLKGHLKTFGVSVAGAKAALSKRLQASVSANLEVTKPKKAAKATKTTKKAPAKPKGKKAKVAEEEVEDIEEEEVEEVKKPKKAPTKPKATKTTKAPAKPKGKKAKVVEEVEDIEEEDEKSLDVLAAELNDEDLSAMDAATLKIHLKAFGASVAGAKAALVKRLQASIAANLEAEEEEAEEEEEEEAEEEEEKPKPAKKAPAKPKGKKVKVEVEEVEEVIEDDENDIEDEELEFPKNVKIPNVVYHLSATDLLTIINYQLEMTSEKSEFLDGVISALEKYSKSEEKTAKAVKVTKKAPVKSKASSKKTAEPDDEEVEAPKPKGKKAKEVEEDLTSLASLRGHLTRLARAKVEEEEVEEEVEEEAEEEEVEEVEEEEEEEKKTFQVDYDDEMGVYVDSRGFVYDKDSSCIYGKVVDDAVVPIEKKDLKDLGRFRLWHVSVKKRADDKFTTAAEIKKLNESNLLKEDEEVVEDEENESDKVEEEAEGEIEEEEAEEEPKVTKATSKVTAKPKSSKVTEVTEGSDEEKSEGGDDGDTIEKVEGEIKEMTTGKPTIDEKMFEKFVNAQYTPGMNRGDHAAISKAAGIDEKMGEEIMLQYKALADRYSHIITNAAAKKPAPKGFGNKTVVQQKPQQRRLLQKK
jgi:hypothetical protein